MASGVIIHFTNRWFYSILCGVCFRSHPERPDHHNDCIRSHGLDRETSLGICDLWDFGRDHPGLVIKAQHQTADERH